MIITNDVCLVGEGNASEEERVDDQSGGGQPVRPQLRFLLLHGMLIVHRLRHQRGVSQGSHRGAREPGDSEEQEQPAQVVGETNLLNVDCQRVSINADVERDEA